MSKKPKQDYPMNTDKRFENINLYAKDKADKINSFKFVDTDGKEIELSTYRIEIKYYRHPQTSGWKMARKV